MEQLLRTPQPGPADPAHSVASRPVPATASTGTTPHPFPRQPGHSVDERFLHRWSPRSFRTAPVSRHVLHAALEAARWAPSSVNDQPWRFFVSDDPSSATRQGWNEAVNSGNRAWSDKAPVLVWVVAQKAFTNPRFPLGTPNRHSWFDTGAAALSFVLEAQSHGVYAHYLGGIDAAKAHQLLGLDEQQEVVCALVLGYPDQPEALPAPLREREVPSGRKEVAQFATFA